MDTDWNTWRVSKNPSLSDPPSVPVSNKRRNNENQTTRGYVRFIQWQSYTKKRRSLGNR